MDLSHIAHWIQRQDEELLYAPDGEQLTGPSLGWAWWEGVDSQMVAALQAELGTGVGEEEDCRGSDWTPPPVDDSMPRARPAPDVRRCRALVNGQEVGGVIDVGTGIVTLDDPPAPGLFSLCVVWIAERSSDVRIAEETGALSSYLDIGALQHLEVGAEAFSLPLMRRSGTQSPDEGRETISRDDLRQLSESLPRAFAIAARALGLEMPQLNQRLETGTLRAEDFLPKFAAQLRQERGLALEDVYRQCHGAWRPSLGFLGDAP